MSNNHMVSVPFQREDRYIVIKRSDLNKVPVNYRSALVDPMFSLLSHLPNRECLVIESDWPEFEPAWASIEARVSGSGATTLTGSRLLELHSSELRAARMEIITLRAQLAERDALLRELLPLANRAVKSAWSQGIVIRAESALSASADQSAPVETDERAEFEKAWAGAVNVEVLDLHRKQYPLTADADQPYDTPQTQLGWMMWQARAALERKL